MKKTRNIGKSYLKLASLLMFPCALFGTGAALANHDNVSYAQEASYSYSTGYRENVDVSNPSFASGSSPYATGASLSGWTSTIGSSKAKGMIIDVGNVVESEEGNVETEAFAKYKNTYLLSANPMAKDKNDTRILMINSKSSSSQSNVQEKQGYKSTSLTLQANSYYVFKVSAKTMLNGDAFAESSIYLSGLVDKDGKKFDLAYEKISPTSWTDYYFFVATGKNTQTVNLELYLGSKNTKSEGVAFFDYTSAYRYSENEFFALCTSHNYKGTDSAEITNGDKIFMVDKLAEEHKSVEDITGYNFDFEDEGALLSDNWTALHRNGKALIIDYADFATTTGLSNIGNDLSYENDRALVMQTTSNEYSSSYVGLTSKQIQIKPHAAYKVSLKLKVADMTSGSFYLKLVENDYIYDIYTETISDDSSADNYLSLGSGKTSGYTSNVSNNWTNDYQTIDFYVKGHSLYTSYVNLELWLGDQETGAVGCVVIDDINVEMVSDSEIDSANSLTLTSNTESTSITNASFDAATSANSTLEYPLAATSWTAVKGDDYACESGVVYLDGNSYSQLGTGSVYDLMYEDKYDWAGINPGNSNSSNKPSNVYMMFNRQNSYQSLQSPSFSLSGSEYYKVSFDYYNQVYRTTNESKFKVEIVDNNGITLFSQSDVQNLENWATMNIYLKANSSTTQNIYVKIYFGEEGSKVGGMLYLDKFNFESSTQEAFESATFTTDTTGFYTKLDLGADATNKVVGSSAYSFAATSMDSNYTDSEVAFGGVVSGNNTIYDITNDNDNLLVVTTTAAAKATLTSKFKKEFSANSYYKLTFSLATIFNPEAENAATDEHDCKYGVTVKFDSFEEIVGLTTDGTLKEYTIYFKTGDSSTTPTFEFTLNSDCDNTTGTAILTNLDFTTSDEDTYLFERTQSSFNKTVFASEYVKAEEDEQPEETPDNEPETEADGSTAWLAASSIITGVAIIVAILGLVLKNVKIKKIEKIKTEVYDRRLNKNHELIMAQAQKLRDEEIENLIAARDCLENEKTELEEAHKQYMRNLRNEKQGKISKDVEKRFKQYTSRTATINEKINIIKEKINYTMSADHLIELERKVVAMQDSETSKRKRK
ncbi:MAG: hypothetical protein IJY90_03670 [Clostridia bacterium]|nr:hypothetical protein [Clostridia bacterium]